MKGSQRESTVVRVAAEELKAMLRQRPGIGHTRYWIEREVKHSSKRFRGRADAVVAGVLGDGSVYTICVEAKSMRTLGAIRGRGGCVVQFLVAGTAGGALGAFAWWQIGGPGGIAAWAATFLIFGIAVLWLLERFRFFFSPASVLAQVARYPGNERWLAIAQDALDSSPHAVADLRKDCQAMGIGLLGVNRRGNSAVYQLAARDRDPGDMISEYRRGDSMRHELLTSDPDRSHRKVDVEEMRTT